MKRIEFIAPVEAMRGNLSGSQKLLYARNNNPAWDAPNGKSYARNYKPRFIGAKRAANNVTYFATRVRSAVNNSIESRLAQAVLGSMPMLLTGVETNLSLNGNLFECFNASRQREQGYSLRKYFIEKVRSQVERGAATISIVEYRSSQMHSCYFANPYIKPGISTAATIRFDPDILDKFFDQLGNGFRFHIEGAGDGVAFSSWAFDDLLTTQSGAYNLLGLSKDANDYIKIGDMWLKVRDADDPEDEGVYVKNTEAISGASSSGDEYFLVETAPTA